MSIYESNPAMIGGPAAPLITPLPGLATSAANPTAASLPCPTCGQPPMPVPALATYTPGGFVYAVGTVEARFPSPGVEHEFASATGSDPDAVLRLGDLRARLAEPESRYLAREMVWVFRTRFADVCTIVPETADQLGDLIEMLPGAGGDMVQVLVGAPTTQLGAGPIAGLSAVRPVQLVSCTPAEFLEALPRPDRLADKDTKAYQDTARALLAHLVQRADSAGIAAADRACNYLAIRYTPLYHLTFAQRHAGNDLVHVHTTDSVAGDRRLVTVQLVFRNSHSQVAERYQCQVDTTDLFPFVTRSFERTYD
jgi:hypothetical protein